MRFSIVIAIISLLVCSTAGCASGCDRGYSDGTRAGVITKFSRKGIFNKTWEGQLNLGGMTTDGDGKMVPNVWEFTVTNPNVVPQIQAALESGRPVALKYVQWWVPPAFQMDSDYEIVGLSGTGKAPDMGTGSSDSGSN